MRLDINYRNNTVKNTNIRRLNNTLLNKQEITKEIKKCLETNGNGNTITQNSKSSSERKVYSNTILPKGTRKISNKQPNLTPKAIRERRTKNSQKVAERKKS